uniref:GLOBIN domain-containing protein n=1 Tax=Parastrongyloides trichosuri TaxID=131310 RepID=A0A0N4Z770_PARTI
MSHVRNLFTWFKDKRKKSFTRLRDEKCTNEDGGIGGSETVISSNRSRNKNGKKGKQHKSLKDMSVSSTLTSTEKKCPTSSFHHLSSGGNESEDDNNLMSISLSSGGGNGNDDKGEEGNETNLSTSILICTSTKSLDDRIIVNKKHDVMSESYTTKNVDENKNNKSISKSNNDGRNSRSHFKRASEVYWIPNKGDEQCIQDVVLEKGRNIFSSGTSLQCEGIVEEHDLNTFHISKDLCLKFNTKDQNDGGMEKNKTLELVISKYSNKEEQKLNRPLTRKVSQSTNDLTIFDVIPKLQERRSSITNKLLNRIPSLSTAKEKNIDSNNKVGVPKLVAVCFIDKDKIKEGMSNSYHVFMEDPEEIVFSNTNNNNNNNMTTSNLTKGNNKKGFYSKKVTSSSSTIIGMPLTPSSSAINVRDKSVSLLQKLRDKSGKNISSKSTSNIHRSESLNEKNNPNNKEQQTRKEEESSTIQQSASFIGSIEEKTQSLKVSETSTNNKEEEEGDNKSCSNISSDQVSLGTGKPGGSVSSFTNTIKQQGSKPNIASEVEIEDDVFITPREDTTSTTNLEEEDNNSSSNNKMNISSSTLSNPPINSSTTNGSSGVQKIGGGVLINNNDNNLDVINEGVPLDEDSNTNSTITNDNNKNINKNMSNGSNNNFQQQSSKSASSSRHSSLTKGITFENNTNVLPEDSGNLMDPNQKRIMEQLEKRRQSLALRRASNVQLVQSVSGRRTSTTLIPLTMAQIHLVRSLWRQIYVSKGPTVIGQTIFHRFFFRNSVNREQFRRCPLPEGFPNHDSFSKAHCKATADMIDKVVLNLDNLETIAPDLERIGRVHAEVLNGDLSSKIWNTIAETFIDCTLEWGDKRCRSETVRKAWALIIAFMVEKIKLGHLEQRKLILSMKMRNSQLLPDNSQYT